MIPSSVTSHAIYGSGPMSAPKRATMSLRFAGPRGKVRRTFATPSAALAWHLRSRDSVTESAPNDSVTERAMPGWDKVVSLHDDLPGADRSHRRPELIDLKRSYDGAVNDGATDATGRAMAEKLQAAKRAHHTRKCWIPPSAMLPVAHYFPGDTAPSVGDTAPCGYVVERAMSDDGPAETCATCDAYVGREILRSRIAASQARIAAAIAR